jgi:serine/threonine-protein kinase
MEKFHSYTIESIGELGEGAFGYVEKVKLYNYYNNSCGVYARKILSPKAHILASMSIEEIKKRFIREVIYQSKCVHDNVVNIFLFNKYIENPWFIMELGDYHLESEIAEKSLTEAEKINIIKMMLYGVKKIHDNDYLHRDIKPSNIIKFTNNTYKISDFGLVKNIDPNSDTAALTAIGITMGTEKYMAPELRWGAAPSQQTDIYSLGVVFEELLIENSNFQSIISKCTNGLSNHRYNNIDEILLAVNQATLNSNI